MSVRSLFPTVLFLFASGTFGHALSEAAETDQPRATLAQENHENLTTLATQLEKLAERLNRIEGQLHRHPADPQVESEIPPDGPRAVSLLRVGRNVPDAFSPPHAAIDASYESYREKQLMRIKSPYVLNSAIRKQSA